jgi:hypothetical protein
MPTYAVFDGWVISIIAGWFEVIADTQTSYLGEAQASLDSGQKHRVIASADPRFLVRCAQEGFDFRSSEVCRRDA